MNTNSSLPQLNGKTCITDGGMETEFCFIKKIELPEFASYDLMRTKKGEQIIREYYDDYIKLAQKNELGLILETPTWRANADWGKKIGDSKESLAELNRKSVRLIKSIQDKYSSEKSPIVVSGCVGPRGDGYVPDKLMTEEEAKNYHEEQIQIFVDEGVDLVSVLTLNYIEEAIGITNAAKKYNIPCSISFTVETDAKLASGNSLEEAINKVDQVTDGGPDYYMINCAHPSHFDSLFNSDKPYLKRILGLRGNASCLSHAELDSSEELDSGNPRSFGQEIFNLKLKSPELKVLGGCCGTDIRHIKEICNNLSCSL